MVQVTFLKQWDKFNPGDTRIIEPTLAARLILSGIVVQGIAPKNPDPSVEEMPVRVLKPVVAPVVKKKEAVKPKKPKQKPADKRLKPSQRKGK